MEELKVRIRHVMLREIKNNKNPTETVKIICSVYGQGVNTDYQVRNWFSKFSSGDASLRDEPRPERSSDGDHDVLRELMEWNPRKSSRELTLDLNTSQFIICCYLIGIKQMGWLIHLVRRIQKII